MNPRGRKPWSDSTPLSVSDLIAKDTDELLQMAASEGFGIREQAALKALACLKLIDIPTKMLMTL
jgi:hypothetical protein